MAVQLQTNGRLTIQHEDALGGSSLGIPEHLVDRFSTVAGLTDEEIVHPIFVGAAVLANEEYGTKTDQEVAQLATRLHEADTAIRADADVPVLSMTRRQLAAGYTTGDSSMHFENLNSAVFYGSIVSVPTTESISGEIKLRDGQPSGDTVDCKANDKPWSTIIPDQVLTDANIEDAKIIGRTLSREHIVAVGSEAVKRLFDTLRGSDPGSEGAASRRAVANYMAVLLSHYGFNIS